MGGPTATSQAMTEQVTIAEVKDSACRTQLRSPVQVGGRVGVKLTLEETRARVQKRAGWVRLGLKAYSKSRPVWGLA